MDAMGRPRRPEIRDRLLDACVGHTVEHGLPDTLEPLAAATGTSTRMLLYHFGTRDTLFTLILNRARAHQLASFGEFLTPEVQEAYSETLRRAWSQIRGVEGEGYLRLFRQTGNVELQRLWPGFDRVATTDWLEPLERGLARDGHAELATLVLAVMRGLLMDLDATRDVERNDLAFEHFLSMLDGTP